YNLLYEHLLLTTVTMATRDSEQYTSPRASGPDRDGDLQSRHTRCDERDPRCAGRESRLNRATLFIAANKTGCGRERPHREQDRERMEAAKFDVSADGVRPDWRREEGHELSGECGHRRTERGARPRSAAGDLIETGRLNERQHKGGERKAHDAPPTKPQREDDAGHAGRALGLGSPKKLRKNSSRLGSVLTRSVTSESDIASSSPSKDPRMVHVTRL